MESNHSLKLVMREHPILRNSPFELTMNRRSFSRALTEVALATIGVANVTESLGKAYSARPGASAWETRKLISLNGKGWQLLGLPLGQGETLGIQTRMPQGLNLIPISIPNNVQLSAGVGDPYGQGQELWGINAKEWWYLRSFHSPQVNSSQRVKLVFEGADYFADVWLNGQKLGSHEGAYTQFSFDIGPLLSQFGSNYIAIRVRAPWKMFGRSHFEYMKGEFDSSWDALPGPGQVVFPLGLHRSVRLEVTGPVRVEKLQVWTLQLKEQKASLAIRGTLSNVCSARTVHLELFVKPANFSGPRFKLPTQRITFSGVPAELKEIYLEFTLSDPRLWWTWDLGSQNLYKLSARVSDEKGVTLDFLSVNFGIRTIERNAELQYKLNGRPLLVRGAWYPMSKLYPAETDAWTYEKDLLLARHANMNHLINYTVVEKREFYELADRLGILLFIELPFNQEGPLNVLNREYPRREEYIRWSAQQVAEIVRDLSNHPSIGVWSALSEVTGNGYDFSTSPDPRIAAAADGYRVFSDKMEETVLANDPDALYFKGYCDFGEHHFWEGSLFKGTTYDQQFDAKADFVSEYGALAYFPMESIRKILDPEKVWNVGFRKWSAMELPVNPQRLSYLTGDSYQGLEFLMPELADNVDLHPQSLRNLVNDSQVYQAFLYGYAGDAYRRKLFDPIHGIRSWMFKNFPLKPVSGFGVIDCFNTPMMAFYAQRRTYAPVTISFAVRYALESIPVDSRWTVPIWVSNASSSNVTVVVRAALYSLEGKKLHEQEKRALVLSHQASAVDHFSCDLPGEAGIYLLRGHCKAGGNVLATNEMYVKVVPPATRKPLRLLVLGTPDWAEPVISYLSNLGAKITLVLRKSGPVLNSAGDFPGSAEALREQYDAIWLTGFDSYWREAPQSWAPVIVRAVEGGVAFIHTGSWASFHGGGDDKTAALDLTPLADILPVMIPHANDVWDAQLAALPGRRAASSTEPKIEVSGNAPDWLKQADFGGLYPQNYHVLGPRRGATVLFSVDGQPLLVMGHYGRGRTIAYLGFSPDWGGKTQTVVDRCIRTREGRLFLMVAAAALALASGKDLAAPMAELLRTRVTPIFETLRKLPTGTWPDVSLFWLEIGKTSAKAQIHIKNGPFYQRGLRLRFEGRDFAEGSVLPLWSDQFFDLLPNEEIKCSVELIARRGRSVHAMHKFSIVAEILHSPQTKAYAVPAPSK
jgi:beta-mannosidase